MLMKNLPKYISIIAFLYTGLAIYIFMEFFYYEEMSILLLFVATISIFIPLIFNGYFEVSKFSINLSALLGFVFGFASHGLITELNIWPVALLFWLLLSAPSIIGLNLVSIFIKKHRYA